MDITIVRISDEEIGILSSGGRSTSSVVLENGSLIAGLSQK